MGRREVLVQLDDELVRALDAVAAEAGMNRSEVLRCGARAVLSAYAAAKADAGLQNAYRQVPEEDWLAAAGAKAAATTPPW